MIVLLNKPYRNSPVLTAFQKRGRNSPLSDDPTADQIARKINPTGIALRAALVVSTPKELGSLAKKA
jgi:hypothetical protein